MINETHIPPHHASPPTPEAPTSHSLLHNVINAINLSPNRPSWDDYFMATAFLIASRSPCDRLHVGCVLVSSGEHKNRIIAAGYNGFLPGIPHVSHVRDGHEQATVHAEQNAIADAARRGITLQNSIAYITHFPCINCAKILAASGIKYINYHSNYNNDPLVYNLFEASLITINKL